MNSNVLRTTFLSIIYSPVVTLCSNPGGPGDPLEVVPKLLLAIGKIVTCWHMSRCDP